MRTILVKNLTYMYSNAQAPFHDLSGRMVEDQSEVRMFGVRNAES